MANPPQEKERPSSMIEDATGGNAAALEDNDKLLQELSRAAPPFYKNRNLLRLYLLMIPACLVPAVTLGFDSSMMNGLQSVPTWDTYFGRPRGAILGLLTAILPLGAVIGTPFISLVGDRYGRRVGIAFGGVIMIVGAIIQGAAVNIAMFLIARLLMGFGFVFANTYAPVLIGELSHPKDRQVTTSLYQTSYYMGAIMAAWVTFGTFSMPNDWAWRIPSYLQAAPALLQCIGVWFVPESPRWLIAKHRSDEAKAILVKYHGDNDADSLLVRIEHSEMRAVIEAEMANETGWKSLLKTPGNRRRLLIIMLLGIFSQWSGNGLVSYYLARVLETVGITDPRTQNILNGCLMIFNWICSVLSAIATNWVKRRTQFLISGFGMLGVFAAQTLCAGLFNDYRNVAAGYAVIAMLFLFYVFFNFAFNALLYSYPVEILPYPIRSKGFSVLMFFGKGASFVNVFLNPVGLQGLAWKFYIVYCVWLAIECFLIWKFFVETKGPSLEAIAAVFDGPKTTVDIDTLGKGDAEEYKIEKKDE